MRDNELNQQTVDAMINDIFLARDTYTKAGAKTLDLGGNNAAASAAACEKVTILRMVPLSWRISVNGC